MNKPKCIWDFKKHIVFSSMTAFVLTIMSYFLPLLSIFSFFGPEAASIGIIGGADGPTAVYLTSRGSRHFSVYLILFLVTLTLYKPIKILMEKYLIR